MKFHSRPAKIVKNCDILFGIIIAFEYIKDFELNIVIMKRVFSIMAVTLLCVMSSSAYAQNGQEEKPYIEVSARSEKQITPDIIYLDITINEAQDKGKTSVEEKEKQMILMLQELKIDVEKNLTVDDMSSDLKKYFLRKDNILASKSYVLKLSTADQVAAVFDALNNINISDVSLQKIGVSPELEQQVKNELMVEAMKKAKNNAQTLLGAIGNQVGETLYVNYYESSQSYGSRLMVRNTKAMAVADGVMVEESSIPSLEVSKVTMNVNVNCKFAIK